MGFVGVRSNLNVTTENRRTKWDAVHYVKVSEGQAWESTLSKVPPSPGLVSAARVFAVFAAVCGKRLSLLSDLFLQERVDGSNAAVVLTVVEVFG
jgi:hypothetical protein